MLGLNFIVSAEWTWEKVPIHSKGSGKYIHAGKIILTFMCKESIVAFILDGY